jgi:hypothetical protein
LSVVTRALASDKPRSRHDRYWSFNEILVEPPSYSSKGVRPVPETLVGRWLYTT